MKNHTSKALKAAIVLASVSLSTKSIAGTITFSDTTFNMADYSSQIYQNDPGIVSAPTQSASGNPGTAAEAAFSTTDPNYSIVVGLINSNFNYNPASSGKISDINVSLDRYFLPKLNGTPETLGAFTLRTFIEQGGQFYQAIQSFGGLAGTWTTLSASGLTAADFGLYNFATNSLNTALTPDFSQTIDAFGFGMRASGPGSAACSNPLVPCDLTGTFMADNWSLTLTTAVPEPNSLVLFAAAALASGLVRKRVN